MKIVISFISGVIVMSLIAFTSKRGETDLSLARVQRASGKLVFIRCEPVADYDVIFDVDPLTWGTLDTPEKMADAIVGRSLKKSKKKGDFDAEIIGSTKKDIAIKFKE